MQRVLVIGPCGAGKLTLARDLAALLDLPLFHIDQLNWLPGWVDGGDDRLRARLAEVVVQDRWLIDGNYAGSLDLRVERADAIIYLDYPIRLCLWRLVRRIARHRGRTRPDMTDGCPERFDLSFFLYLLTWKRGPGRRTEARIAGQERKLVRLGNPKALARWLASVKAGSPCASCS